MKTIVTTLVVILICSHAFAEATTPQPIVSGENDILASSFRVIWGLLIVLGIMLVLYGLLKKRFSLLSSHPDKEINILEIKPLMGKKALCLIEVRGKEYLLGVSDSHISNLATLDKKKPQSFSDTLQQHSGTQND
jgi:flagellar protein FliO/FliZ